MPSRKGCARQCRDKPDCARQAFRRPVHGDRYPIRKARPAPDLGGAQEYLGELYVETGQMDKAKIMLASLTKLCPQGCEEREDLEKAIAAGPGTAA
jgi:hypothetical protein